MDGPCVKCVQYTLCLTTELVTLRCVIPVVCVTNEGGNDSRGLGQPQEETLMLTFWN